MRTRTTLYNSDGPPKGHEDNTRGPSKRSRSWLRSGTSRLDTSDDTQPPAVIESQRGWTHEVKHPAQDYHSLRPSTRSVTRGRMQIDHEAATQSIVDDRFLLEPVTEDTQHLDEKGRERAGKQQRRDVQSSPSPTPFSTNGHAVTIDHRFYPHIIDSGVDHLPYGSQLVLRGASKSFRDRINALLVQHLLLSFTGITAAKGPIPFMPDYVTAQSNPSNILAAVAVIDLCCYEDFPVPQDTKETLQQLNPRVIRIHNCEANLYLPQPCNAKVLVLFLETVTKQCRFMDIPLSLDKLVLHVRYAYPGFHGCGPPHFAGPLPKEAVFVFSSSDGRNGRGEDYGSKKKKCAHVVGKLFEFLLHPILEAVTKGYAPTLTIVDLPVVDLAWKDTEPRAPALRHEACRQRLRECLIPYTAFGHLHSPALINEVVSKLRFVSRKEYSQMLPRRDFLLETRVVARDCSP